MKCEVLLEQVSQFKSYFLLKKNLIITTHEAIKKKISLKREKNSGRKSNLETCHSYLKK